MSSHKGTQQGEQVPKSQPGTGPEPTARTPTNRTSHTTVTPVQRASPDAGQRSLGLP